jgi:hypothetical protein
LKRVIVFEKKDRDKKRSRDYDDVTVSNVAT